MTWWPSAPLERAGTLVRPSDPGPEEVEAGEENDKRASWGRRNDEGRCVAYGEDAGGYEIERKTRSSRDAPHFLGPVQNLYAESKFQDFQFF